MPARPSDLRSQALDFAGRISDLLNRTVANGIRISVILQDDGQVGWAGYGITKQQPFPGRGIPLTLSAAPPRCYLHVMHTLVQRYGVLITDVSSFGLYLDEQLDRNIFHYDYTRVPATPTRPPTFRSTPPRRPSTSSAPGSAAMPNLTASTSRSVAGGSAPAWRTSLKP